MILLFFWNNNARYADNLLLVFRSEEYCFIFRL
jgi:hypothetical protein